MKGNFDTAIKTGKPVARQAAKTLEAKNGKAYIASECPLAGEHIVQGMKLLDGSAPQVEHSTHPVEIFARAYGLTP